MVILESIKQRAMTMIKVAEHVSDEDMLEELAQLCVEKRRLRGILAMCINATWGTVKKMEPDSSSVMFSKKRTGNRHKHFSLYRKFHLYIWKARKFLGVSDFYYKAGRLEGRLSALGFLGINCSAEIASMSISWFINAIFHQLLLSY